MIIVYLAGCSGYSLYEFIVKLVIPVLPQKNNVEKMSIFNP
jgi:hypothetical protein